MTTAPNANCGLLFADAVTLRPDSVALMQNGVRIDYSALDARANKVANALRALGVAPGDRVAVLVRNDTRYVEAVFGVLRRGAVVVPVTTRARYDTLHHVLTDSAASVLIASHEFAAESERLTREVESLGSAIVMDGENRSEYDAWRDAAPDKPQCHPVTGAAPAFLCYTSGSTGVPKGVTLTHAGVAWCTDAMRRAMLFEHTDRCLLAVPLFHANATTCGLMPMLAAGGSCVIQKDFDAADVLRALAGTHCTYTSGVPAMYKMMLREDALIDSLDFSALKFVLCSSSEVPEALLRAFTERFGVPMIEGYGLTEGGPMVLSNPRWGPRRAGTSGIPLPGVRVRIIDPDNPQRAVADGETGELLVSSPGVTPGYHKLPALTKERILPGGWLRTQDLARQCDDGYVKIVGRRDDMFICGGENIFPSEVENLLIRHPQLDDVAVLPRADDIKGHVPVAFVVAKPGLTVTPQDVIDFALAEGPAYAHPRSVTVLEELPLTAAKKIDRAALQAKIEH